MLLSCSTAVHVKTEDGARYSVPDAVRLIARAGFDAADICFDSESHGEGALVRDDWARWVEEIGRTLRAERITARQGHAVFHSVLREWTEFEWREWRTGLARAVCACGALHIPVLVAHPLCVKNAEGLTPEECVQMNVERFSFLTPLLAENHVTLALENLLLGEFSGADALCRLVDAFSSPCYAACFDTGHANLAGLNQGAAIKALGARLVALHVNDNDGRSDRHRFPFDGSVDWAAALDALKAIRYAGDLNVEPKGALTHLPPALRPAAMQNAAAIGRYMIDRLQKEGG